jgi:predicted Zn-dependent peptidase
MENIDPALFIFMASCNPKVKAEEVEKELINQIEKLKKELVSQDTLDKIKINTKAEFIYSLESSSSVANLFGSYLARGDIKPLLEYEDAIDKLKPQDIQDAAKKYFNFKKSTTLILRKAEK